MAQGEAHARAVAEVIVNAGVQVSCQGAGYACGFAFGKGSSLAKNIARVMAQAFVDADPRGVDQGTFCHADVEALGEVFAEVAETARAEACARGYQSKEQWVSRYKKIVECAIAQAYVRAAAGFCSSKWMDTSLRGTRTYCESMSIPKYISLVFCVTANSMQG